MSLQQANYAKYCDYQEFTGISIMYCYWHTCCYIKGMTNETKKEYIMKVCENCRIEIGTKDGENLCESCDRAQTKKALRNRRARANRRLHDEVMQSCGLTKVRGSMGGTYWE
jgi:hypothetical protein